MYLMEEGIWKRKLVKETNKRIITYIYLFIFRIPLRDNRDNSYKQAIATNISSRTQMILCVIGGAKSQYDVIKKYCCRESPGMFLVITKDVRCLQCKFTTAQKNLEVLNSIT